MYFKKLKSYFVSESTLRFLGNKADGHYVKTTLYENARKVLLDTNLLILTGHPGEGKTAMAANLALEGGAKREQCVKLECARDWEDVDWTLRCFTTVIIDDIFGGISLDHQRFKEWKNVLNDIEQFAKNKELKVIITSRHYITEEAREEMDKITMFTEKPDYTVHLDSTDLSSDEMKCILKAVLERSGTEENMEKFGIDLDACVEKATGVFKTLPEQTSGSVFGFPECAVLFATGIWMERHGSEFFGRPESHFKTYVEQLYKSTDTEQFYKFLSLVIIWSEKTQRIKKEDLQNPLNLSAHIRKISSSFGVQVDHFFIETLKLSLNAYTKFLLLYINESGEYTFTHNVIGEMVGVVLGEHRPRECIQLCQRDFLMNRITVLQSDQDHLKVFIPPILESVLIKKIIQMLCRDGCNFTEAQSEKSYFDADILKHAAFENNCFAKAFVMHIISDKLEDKIFKVLVKNTRVNIHTPIYLLEFTLQNKLFTLAKHIIYKIKELLGNGDCVSVYAIYIVMQKLPSLFETLVEFKGHGANAAFIAGMLVTYLLVEAARGNYTLELSCLLKHGANPNSKDDWGTSALHCAAINNNKEMIEELLKYGARVNAKDSEGRTGLYHAVINGRKDIVKMFLNQGAEVNTRTNSKETPLFDATHRGHHAIMEDLLRQGAKVNIKSDIGFTPLHLAVLNNDNTAVQILLTYGADVEIKNGADFTADETAVNRGYFEIAEELRNHRSPNKCILF